MGDLLAELSDRLERLSSENAVEGNLWLNHASASLPLLQIIGEPLDT
jgi:hypothetical protein